MRWRHGDTNPVVAAVDSAQVIEIGDLLWLNTDDARPASQQADQGTEDLNQQEFAKNFLGVAEQRSRSGDTDPIRVATSGVFEYVCPSGTFEIGDLIGPSEASSGTALEDQQVEGVTQYYHAIGRCARRQASAVTTVLVEIKSTVMHGGVAGTSGA
jgi:hypothetical protein